MFRMICAFALLQSLFDPIMVLSRQSSERHRRPHLHAQTVSLPNVQTVVQHPCKLVHTRLNAKNINWARFLGEELTVLHDQWLNVSHCAGTCEDVYERNSSYWPDVLLRAKLVQFCSGDEENCKKLQPCCVARRFYSKRGRSCSKQPPFPETSWTGEFYDKKQSKRFTRSVTIPRPIHCVCS